MTDECPAVQDGTPDTADLRWNATAGAQWVLRDKLRAAADALDRLRADLATAVAERDDQKEATAVISGEHDYLWSQIVALSIEDHECVWDVTEWICQNCWADGLPSKWPCDVAAGRTELRAEVVELKQDAESLTDDLRAVRLERDQFKVIRNRLLEEADRARAELAAVTRRADQATADLARVDAVHRDTMRQWAAAEAQRDRALEAIKAVTALHPEAADRDGSWCSCCNLAWPCPTVAALSGVERPPAAPAEDPCERCGHPRGFHIPLCVHGFDLSGTTLISRGCQCEGHPVEWAAEQLTAGSGSDG